MKKYLVVYEWLEDGKKYITGQDFYSQTEAENFLAWMHENHEVTDSKLIDVMAAKAIAFKEANTPAYQEYRKYNVNDCDGRVDEKVMEYLATLL